MFLELFSTLVVDVPSGELPRRCWGSGLFGVRKAPRSVSASLPGSVDLASLSLPGSASASLPGVRVVGEALSLSLPGSANACSLMSASLPGRQTASGKGVS